MKGEMAKTIIKRRYELPVEKKAKDILRLNSAKNSCFQTEEAEKKYKPVKVSNQTSQLDEASGQTAVMQKS